MTISRRLRWTLLSVAGLIVLFIAFAYLVAPGLIRSVAQEKGSALLGRKLTITSVEVNPFALSARVDGLQLFAADGSTPEVRIETLFVNISSASLLHLAPVIDELYVVKPEIRISRLDASHYSFSDVLERILAQPKSDGPARFSINNIHVQQGDLRFDDRVTSSQHRVENMELTIPAISNLPHDVEVFVEPAFSARVDGSSVALHGKTRPFTKDLQSDIALDIDHLELSDYVAFSPVPLRFKLVSGQLGGVLAFAFQRGADGVAQIKLSGQLALTRLNITHPGGAPAIAAREIAVKIREIDVLKGSVALDSLVLDAPVINVRRDSGGIDLPGLFVGDQAATPPAERTAPAMPLQLAQFTIHHGAVQYSDSSAGRKPAELSLKEIEASVSGFSTVRNAPAKVALSLQPAAGQTLSTQGEVVPASRSGKLQFKIDQLQPASFSAFTAPYLAARIDKGAIDASGDVDFDFGADHQALRVEALQVAATQFRMALPGDKDPAVAAERLTIEGGSFDLVERKLGIAKIAVDGAAINLSRDAQGKLNLAGIMAPHAAVAAPAASPATTAAATPASGKPAPAFSALLKTLSVDRSAITFNDASTATPVAIHASAIKLTAQNLGTAPGLHSPFDLAATLEKRGQLSIKGDAVATPLAVTARIAAQRIPVAMLQAYAGDRLNLTVASADVSLRGDLKLAGTPLTANFSGAGDVTDVVTLDKVNSAGFVRFKALNFGKIDLQYPAPGAPFALGLANIALSDFYARVIVNPTGRLNLQDVVTPAGGSAPQSITTPGDTPVPAASPPPVAAGPSPIIRLGQVGLARGNINFTDNFVKPNYSANLTDLAGAISGVSSDKPAPADLKLTGRIDGDGALDVTGQVNPLAKPLYLDLSAAAKAIELTRLSPYAIKYAGYPIEKGKLTMTVKYHIENNQLQAQNKLFLDQLTFGEHVENTTATKLPVLLAVRLLQNSRGEIDVDLPISGSLSDPQFSVGGVIVRVLINLLERAITSPFRLLAGAGGGAEDLGYVEFAPGETTLTPDAQAKLTKIGSLLTDKPTLKFDITGRADPVTDPDGARRMRLAGRVKGQKFRVLQRAGQTVDWDDITVDASEYPKYLEAVYKDMDFPKEKNVLGLTKSLPPAEMEKLIFANMPVDNDDLLALASRRANTVREFIEKSGAIPPERVFLVAPKLIAADKKTSADAAAAKPNRVDFSLR